MSCTPGEPWGYFEFWVVRISKEIAENAGSKLRRKVSSGEKLPALKSHNTTEKSAMREDPGVGEGALGTGAQKGLLVEGKLEETVVARGVRGERTSWCEASQSSISVSNKQGQMPWKGQIRTELNLGNLAARR